MLTDYFGKLPQKELGAFAEREAHMDQDQVGFGELGGAELDR